MHLQLLAFSAVRQDFNEGDVIVKQGVKGGAAFLILNGRADITSTPEGKIGSAGPGAMLGEMAMIGDGPYAVSARATETVKTARIDRGLFMRVATEYPEFGTAVFNALARKLDMSMQDLGAIRQTFEQAKSFKDL